MLKDPKSIRNCTFPLQYSNAARESFRVILQALNFSVEKRLLLPAYIGITEREGSGVFDPVLETATPHDFYHVNHKLSAVREDLYERIRSGNYRALLVIHYFGFCQNDIQEIALLCKQNHVLLIEDCAHTMISSTSQGELGSFGDFCFYSLHKFLPVNDGGCLRINNPDYIHLLDSPPSSRAAIGTLDVAAKINLEAIREKRRTNYMHFLGMVKEIEELECMYPNLPDGITPLNFPVIMRVKKREQLYFKLIERGIPVIALYYRLIDPINEVEFPEEHFVSKHILNFPIHQDIELLELKKIAKVLQSVI